LAWQVDSFRTSAPHAPPDKAAEEHQAGDDNNHYATHTTTSALSAGAAQRTLLRRAQPSKGEMQALQSNASVPTTRMQEEEALGNAWLQPRKDSLMLHRRKGWKSALEIVVQHNIHVLKVSSSSSLLPSKLLPSSSHRPLSARPSDTHQCSQQYELATSCHGVCTFAVLSCHLNSEP